ncbi:radical SAM protein [Alteromonas sp. ZYF713]|nr:radical SAM protein [Alteromonas sp. ZYF713]
MGEGSTQSNELIDNARSIVNQIQVYTSTDSGLKARYDKAKKTIRAFRKPAFYEIETKCNLKCEGCYYFEGGDTWNIDVENPVTDWNSFFEKEKRRGVTMAYFVGAEPALSQDRLVSAAEHFQWGNIGTNGTIKLSNEIPYRIGVSVWAGDEDADIKLRGANSFRKALRNYQGDPRAIMLFTVTPQTISQVAEVARLCREHGVELTFNMYSPTHSYLNKIASAAKNNTTFFRFSNEKSSLIFNPKSLAEAREAMGSALDDFPETVRYCHEYNDYMCQPGSRYRIDPNGVATNCQSRIVDPMRYHTVDFQTASVKCCTPDVDCSDCRMYSGGWSSRFIPAQRDVESVDAFKGWLNTIDTLGRIFLYPLPEWLAINAEEKK